MSSRRARRASRALSPWGPFDHGVRVRAPSSSGSSGPTSGYHRGRHVGASTSWSTPSRPAVTRACSRLISPARLSPSCHRVALTASAPKPTVNRPSGPARGGTTKSSPRSASAATPAYAASRLSAEWRTPSRSRVTNSTGWPAARACQCQAPNPTGRCSTSSASGRHRSRTTASTAASDTLGEASRISRVYHARLPRHPVVPDIWVVPEQIPRPGCRVRPRSRANHFGGGRRWVGRFDRLATGSHGRG